MALHAIHATPKMALYAIPKWHLPKGEALAALVVAVGCAVLLSWAHFYGAMFMTAAVGLVIARALSCHR